MRALTAREKKTIGVTAVLLAVYLLSFYGIQGWRLLEAKRAEYNDLRLAIAGIEGRILLEKEKESALRTLTQSLGVDLESLRADTVVAESLAAIQKAAEANAVNLGASKEVQSGAPSGELARFQLQGKSTVLDATKFVHQLLNLSYPLIIERVALKSAGMKPGNVELSLNVVVLDFKTWKKPEESRV